MYFGGAFFGERKQDAKRLSAWGYQAAKVQPGDLFPFAEHVETGVLWLEKLRTRIIRHIVNIGSA